MERNLVRPLTGLRFYAALLVFAVHLSMLPGMEWLGHKAAMLQGNIGVGVFFVLSGYIMSHVYFRSMAAAPSWDGTLRFLIARITRIFPLHLLTLVLCLPLALNSSSARVDPASLPGHILLLQEFNPFADLGPSPNKVAWTLSCELLFYVLTPPLFLVMAALPERRQRMLPIALFLLIVTLTFCFIGVEGVRLHSAPFRLADYLAGVSLFMVEPAFRRWSGMSGGLLLSLGILWFAGLVGLEFADIITTDTALPLLPGSVLVVAGVSAMRDRPVPMLSSDLLMRLGVTSFALYMGHEMLLRYLRVAMVRADVHIGPLWAIPFLVLVFLLVQWFSGQLYDRFEHPVQRWGRSKLLGWTTSARERADALPLCGHAVERPDAEQR